MYRIDPHTCPMYSFEPPIFPAIWPMYSFDPCFSTKTYDVEFWGTYHLWSMPTQTPPEYPPGACPDSKVHWPTWTLLSGRLLVKCIFIHGKLCPPPPLTHTHHYSDVVMNKMASQMTSLTIIFSIVYSGADQRKHLRSASLDFVTGEFPVHSARNAENVYTRWRHHASCTNSVKGGGGVWWWELGGWPGSIATQTRWVHLKIFPYFITIHLIW